MARIYDRAIKREKNVYYVLVAKMGRILRDLERVLEAGHTAGTVWNRVWEKYFSTEIPSISRWLFVVAFCGQGAAELREDAKIIGEFFAWACGRGSTRITRVRSSWILLRSRYEPRLKASTLPDVKALLYFAFHCRIPLALISRVIMMKSSPYVECDFRFRMFDNYYSCHCFTRAAFSNIIHFTLDYILQDFTIFYKISLLYQHILLYIVI